MHKHLFAQASCNYIIWLAVKPLTHATVLSEMSQFSVTSYNAAEDPLTFTLILWLYLMFVSSDMCVV